MTDVSIVIPTYNREHSVLRSIGSCLSDQNLSVEVIVVDDGSSDQTQQILLDAYQNWQQETTSDGFILTQQNLVLRYCFQHNSGAPAARNLGLQNATGRYVKFLDSDDYLVPEALTQEINTADSESADALLTGWILLTVDDQGKAVAEQSVAAPDLSNGIDDMLDGKGPCASAGLYRRSRINHLSWDESITKAQDWMWAWTVCLDGVRFARLDIPSSYYVQHHSDKRITQQGDAKLRSTLARLDILGKVENMMHAKHLFTDKRKTKLAQYYYKDAQAVCEQSERQWLELHKKIHTLAGAFVPAEPRLAMRLLIRFLGLKQAVLFFVRLKKYIKPTTH